MLNNKPINIIIIALAIIFIFSFSEFSNIRNNPNFYPDTFFTLANITAKKGKFNESMKILLFGANITINHNKKIYHSIIPNKYQLNIIPLKDHSYSKDITEYLINIDNYKNSFSPGKYTYSRVFYDLSLLYYKNDDKAESKNLMEASYYLNPELSYSAIELANYYYLNNDINRALKILETCQKLAAPTQHCGKYLNYFKNQNSALDPGFLKNEVNQFYLQ